MRKEAMLRPSMNHVYPTRYAHTLIPAVPPVTDTQSLLRELHPLDVLNLMFRVKYPRSNI